MRPDHRTMQDTASSAPDTLPKAVTAGIRAFCRTISDCDPIFVRCRPDRDAAVSECFDNVARKIGRAGGSTACGWAIWTTPGVYFEAEHHGVWRRRTGELVDVSPQPNSPKRILFLPDPAAVYNPLVHRTNVLAVASDDPAAIEFVALGKRRNEIHGAYREGGNRLALFTLSDQKELGSIEQRLRILSGQLLRFTGPRFDDPEPPVQCWQTGHGTTPVRSEIWRWRPKAANPGPCSGKHGQAGGTRTPRMRARTPT